MFYLKYRPKKFSEVVGLDNVVTTLRRFLTQAEKPHAFLFAGPRGSGKTTTARLLAKALNCENPSFAAEGIEVCDECRSCRSIGVGSFLDLIEIDAASNRGIDDVRTLRERVKLAPTFGRYKVYIIDEAHMLTIEAANALLKTLEEPPKHAIFVLATTEPHKIPETIKSRCHVFNFKRANRESLLTKMNRILEKESLTVPAEKLEEIVNLAEGGFRDAETLLEQVSQGLSDFGRGRVVVSTFVDLLIEGRRAAALAFITERFECGESLTAFTQNLLFYLRDLLLTKSGVPWEGLKLDSGERERIVGQTGKVSREEIWRWLSVFIKASQQFKSVSIVQLPLELAVIELLGEDSEAVDGGRVEGPGGSHDEDSGKSVVSAAEAPEPVGPVSESGEPPAPTGSLSFDAVKEKWSEILKEVKPENHSLEALLRSTRPQSLTGQILTLEVFYKFHKEKLTQRQNLQILERVMRKVLGGDLKIDCVLAKVSDRREKGAKSLPEEGEEDVAAAALKEFIGV